MKRIISIILLVATVFGLASCGTINRKSEVSVLWSDMSDTYLASVADALDRAMYIKNINYEHYDANKDSATQLNQASAAIDKGASALVVNAIDKNTASQILTLATAANIPLIFLCTDSKNLPDGHASYDKCYVIDADPATTYTTLGEKIAEDLFANYADYDKDDDGAIRAATFRYADLAIDTINAKLLELYNELPEKKQAKNFNNVIPEVILDENKHICLTPETSADIFLDTIFHGYKANEDDAGAPPVELIITDDDSYVNTVILTIRKYGFNDENLVTHFIPVYTVGNFENASILEYGPEADDAELNHKKEKTRKDKQATRDAYTVMSAIDSGYISAAVLENDDDIAIATATILRNIIKDNDPLDNISSSYISGNKILLPYTIYGN